MQRIDKYNVLASSIAAFSSKRFQLGRKYGLENYLTPYDKLILLSFVKLVRLQGELEKDKTQNSVSLKEAIQKYFDLHKANIFALASEKEMLYNIQAKQLEILNKQGISDVENHVDFDLNEHKELGLMIELFHEQSLTSTVYNNFIENYFEELHNQRKHTTYVKKLDRDFIYKKAEMLSQEILKERPELSHKIADLQPKLELLAAQVDPNLNEYGRIALYKQELRQLVKQRRIKNDHWYGETALNFYVDMFFESLIAKKSILAILRRSVLAMKYAHSKSKTELAKATSAQKFQLENLDNEKANDLNLLVEQVLKDFAAKNQEELNSGDHALGQLEAAEVLRLQNKLEDYPFIVESPINLGRTLEIEAMAKNQDLYAQVADLEASKTSQIDFKFNPKIGVHDYLKYDSALPSLFYAYPNSYYIPEDRLNLQLEEIKMVNNKRKDDHEAMFSDRELLSLFVSDSYEAGRLIRAYLGLLNTEEFTRLREIAEDIFPEINFPFTILYQAIHSQLLGYLTLVQANTEIATKRASMMVQGLNQDHIQNLSRVLTGDDDNYFKRLERTTAWVKELQADPNKNIVDKRFVEYLEHEEIVEHLPERLAQTVYSSNYNDRSGIIALYYAAHGEYPTQNIIRLLYATGYKVALPYIVDGENMYFSELASVNFNDPDYFIRNDYGIIEPIPYAHGVVHFSDISVVATPVVAFDPGLKRMGMGGGYYDRLFGRYRRMYSTNFLDPFVGHTDVLRPEFIGLAYSWQEVPYTYPEKHDLLLSRMVLMELLPIGNAHALKYSLTQQEYEAKHLAKVYQIQQEAQQQATRFKELFTAPGQPFEYWHENQEIANEQLTIMQEQAALALAEQLEIKAKTPEIVPFSSGLEAKDNYGEHEYQDLDELIARVDSFNAK
ncbi:5-formyltetrahydrofolate cyclo-ligase [Psittacicella hinzii]|uniref:5-formyltetrahydrofolate cyclo-ligase n=1 Tax=Psittacicella hinzii TaxID=2028575 RepID=A0A3A1YKW6_9GAMM|nr:5-formyltetrahydrofolate cyclo-ligase [Psittacicella hinzii]RIY38913.1 hypothetical protein CKF58_03125 [Psittacicella hinzii]